MELDELIRETPAPPEQIVEGVLVMHAGAPYARVDGQPALWGPLVGAEHLNPGDELVLAQTQDGTPFVIWPAAGAAAGGGGDKNYVHTQSSPNSIWDVTHGLDKYPAVDVVDSGGSLVLPNVAYVDANTLQLTFGSATSGKAYVN